jgi:hypothetical protein
MPSWCAAPRPSSEPRITDSAASGAIRPFSCSMRCRVGPATSSMTIAEPASDSDWDSDST